MPAQMIAFDVGNSGGRVHVGSFAEGRIHLEEIHRFHNGPSRLGERWYWDILAILKEIQTGLLKALKECNAKPVTLGMDTWGVDYGYLDSHGEIMSIIRHHRDPRTNGIYEKIFEKINKPDLYKHTGSMFLQINTLLHVYADHLQNPWLHENASSFLMIPDLINYLLTGERLNETTIASTTQFFNPTEKRWSFPVLESLDIPTDMFREIVKPGTVIGPLQPSVLNSDYQSSNISVIAVGSHDTASAIAATPLPKDRPSVFISSGTWSLLGIELPVPDLSEDSLALNFTNECGVGDKIIYHKILGGLWLIQECRRCWEQEGRSLSYARIHEAASRTEPLRHLFDADEIAYMNPENLPRAIINYRKNRNLPAPETMEEIARSIYDSLALNFRFTIDGIERIIGKKVESVHIVGGGAQVDLLCRSTANATGKTVFAGPVEATAAGNMLMQLDALGEIAGLDEARDVVGNSFQTKVYEPMEQHAWEEAYGIFKTFK